MLQIIHIAYFYGTEWYERKRYRDSEIGQYNKRQEELIINVDNPNHERSYKMMKEAHDYVLYGIKPEEVDHDYYNDEQKNTRSRDVRTGECRCCESTKFTTKT